MLESDTDQQVYAGVGVGEDISKTIDLCHIPTGREETISHMCPSLMITTHMPCSHSQFYPTREPFANGTRRVARVHTASGSSDILRLHQEVFAAEANGTRRVGAAV